MCIYYTFSRSYVQKAFSHQNVISIEIRENGKFIFDIDNNLNQIEM